MDDMHACVCCLQRSQDKDLTTSYTHHDRTEIYTVMLKDCFNIQLVLDGWGSCGICSLCAGRLRDASDFKLQVQRCQAELRARSQPKTSVEGSIQLESEWYEQPSCVKEEPPYSEITGAVSDGSEAAVLAGVSEARILAGVSEAAMLAGVSEAPILAGVSEAPILAGVSEAARLAGVSEAARLAGVSEAAMLAGLYDDHVVKDELVLGPERPHRPCVGSTPQEESPLKQEAATVEETELLDSERPVLSEVPDGAARASDGPAQSERPVLSEVPDGAARASDGPAREYCENEYIMQSSVLLRAESPVSLRARSQLAAKCAVRLERLRHSRTYCCDMCTQLFKDKSTLITHIRTHHRCQVCNKTFMMSSCLSRHEPNCTENKQKKRNLIEKSTLTRSHCGEVLYTCDECGKGFRVKSVLLKHLQRSHLTEHLSNNSHRSLYKRPKHHTQISCTDNKPFHCSRCAFKASNKSDLQRHLRIHTGEKPFKCGYCEYRCSRKSSLQRHQRIHTGEKPFKCGYCEYRCSRKSSLRSHQRIHTGEKPFRCGYCEYQCADKSNLLTHQRIHTGEKPFKCGYCDYKSGVQSNLQTHQRIHTGEKPFKCGYCDYMSSAKSDLKRHQKIHTGEKPFKCDYCDFKSGVKSYLKTHQRIHTGEKPFKCVYCEYRCIRKSRLQTHQRIHTGEKPFKCAYCDYKSGVKSDLKRHQKIHIG